MFQKLSQRPGLALMFPICVALLSGCATLGFKQPQPVTVGQVIQMSKEGLPGQTIVQRMRDSGNVLPPHSGAIGGAARSRRRRSGPGLYAANLY